MEDILSNIDIGQAFNLLQNRQKRIAEEQAQKKREQQITIGIIVLAFVVVVGLFYYLNKKK